MRIGCLCVVLIVSLVARCGRAECAQADARLRSTRATGYFGVVQIKLPTPYREGDTLSQISTALSLPMTPFSGAAAF